MAAIEVQRLAVLQHVLGEAAVPLSWKASNGFIPASLALTRRPTIRGLLHGDGGLAFPVDHSDPEPANA